MRFKYFITHTLGAVSALAFLAAFPHRVQAQESVCDSATIHFSQSHSSLSLSMPGNRASLDSIVGFMSRYSLPDSGFTLRRVHITGSASPEGSVAINERLSRQRAERIFDYISSREAVPDSVTSFTFLGRDWAGLRALVLADTRVPYRKEVLEIIDTTLAGGSVQDSNRGLARLRTLRSGVPYRYMYTCLFPSLRYSTLFVEYSAPRVAAPQPETILDTLEMTSVTEDVIVTEPEEIAFGTVKECRPFYMGLKTNLLYDALALPTLGAEFYVGKNWSVGLNWTYGWWSRNSRHRYWRAYGGDINVRRWFGAKAKEKPLTGHHLGAFFGVVTYDFEFGGKGNMGGLPGRTLWDRCNYFGGIEYGYSLPIGRRLNIDFTVGIGYMGGKYLEYKPVGDRYVWEKTLRRNWVGPTKAEISLVWLIGCDNYNRNHKKGGEL